MTLRKRLSLPVLLAVTLLAGGCGVMRSCSPGVAGSGKTVEETREVAPFSRIEVGSGVHATVAVGAKSPLKIRGDDNLVALFKTEVVGDTLSIKMVPGSSFKSANRVEVEVGTESLVGASASGGSTLISNRLSGDAEGSGGSILEFAEVSGEAPRLTGSGGTTMKLGSISAGKSLRIEGSGASRWSVAGSAPSLELELSGGAGLQAPKLQVESAKIELSGGSRAELEVARSVDGALSGGSTLLMSGDAAVGTLPISGGSKLERK